MSDLEQKDFHEEGRVAWTRHRLMDSHEQKQAIHFRSELIATEPLFAFEGFAKLVQQMPESELYIDQKWRKDQSSEVESLIEQLVTLRQNQSILAMKLLALIASSVSAGSQFYCSLTSLFGSWMGVRNPIHIEDVETALIIYKYWKIEGDFLTKLKYHLLDQFIALAAVNPKLLLSMTAEFRTNRISDFPCERDLVRLTTLARLLKDEAPEVSRYLFVQRLYDFRYQLRSNFGPPVTEIEELVIELFALDRRRPGTDSDVQYSQRCLAQYMHPLNPHYSTVLNTLFEKTEEMSIDSWYLSILREIAINAPPTLEVYAKSLIAFSKAIRVVSYGELDGTRKAYSLTRLLVETIQLSNPSGFQSDFGRNLYLPKNPNHPIISIATQAYWDLLEVLRNAQSPSLMEVLMIPISEPCDAIKEKSIEILIEVFPSLAAADPEQGGRVILRLAEWSRARANREAESDWRTDIFDQLYPVFEKISKPLAEKMRERGFFDPRSLR